MGISQGRIAATRDLIYTLCNAPKTLCYEEIARIILETDEAYSATHQPAAPVPDSEPELPKGVAIQRSLLYDDDCYDRDGSSVVAGYTPEELEQIAQHIRWRNSQRTREQEAPQVTAAMRVAAWNAFNKTSQATWDESLTDAIAAALEAQRSEARKGN